MISKKILLPVVIGAAFYLSACGDDASGPSNPINPTPSSATPIPGLSSSSITPVPNSSTPTPGSSAGPVPVNYATLAPAANFSSAVSNYALWKSYHFTTKEADALIYPSLAPEFAVAFLPQYEPAGRVIWSNQSGYYRAYCSEDDVTNPQMKFRKCTVSEGIGYGMLLAYFNNDDDTFIRLWNYTRAFREYHNRKLMPWITPSFDWSVVDNSSATDADEDIATALILMYYKSAAMGNPAAANLYLADALTFVNAIWNMEVNPATKLIYSGDEDLWKGANPVYNLSYFSPVALRLFALVDPSHDWLGVLDAMYAYMQLVQSMGTGVFPDWSDGTGNAANPPNESAGTDPKTYTWFTFNKESVRIPWRIAWDYYWYQDPRAAGILTTLNAFISAKSNNNPDDEALSVNYSWNLAVGADYTRNTAVASQWYAAWCATGLAGNAAWLNACTTGLNTRAPSNTGSSYFADILLTMYSALLNGLFLRPAGV